MSQGNAGVQLTLAAAVNDERRITGIYLVRNPNKLLQPRQR
jgi:hypothetical protein